MARPVFSLDRYLALAAVHRDQVRFLPGRGSASPGFAWSESAGGHMPPSLDHVLRQLRTADLLEVRPQQLLGQHWHRVMLTPRGCRLLQEWDRADRPVAA